MTPTSHGNSPKSKYLFLLHFLNDDELYSPGKIVFLAGSLHLLSDSEKTKARKSLIFVAGRYLPKNEEGFVRLFGQPPAKGWRGSTWKNRCHVRSVPYPGTSIPHIQDVLKACLRRLHLLPEDSSQKQYLQGAISALKWVLGESSEISLGKPNSQNKVAEINSRDEKSQCL